jgi:hypothetical protein
MDTVKTLELEAIRHTMTCVLDRHQCKGVELDAMVDKATSDLVLRLHSFTYGRRSSDATTIKHPATWWDGFKLSYYDRWWLRWCWWLAPIRIRRITIRAEGWLAFPEVGDGLRDRHRNVVLTEPLDVSEHYGPLTKVIP